MPAKAKETATTKLSDPASVNAWMAASDHPLKDVAEALRAAILEAGATVGEEIAWNAPAFFYTGEMAPFKPKEHKRHIVVFNFFKKDCIRLVFLRGALINDTSGLLTGDYADGRRLAFFLSMDEVMARKNELQHAVKQLLGHMV